MKGELFGTEMVRAYLDGRKKHTARSVQYYKRTPSGCGRDKLYKIVETLNGNPFYGAGFYRDSDVFQMDGETHIDAVYFRAKHRPGDYIYCRETWADLRGMGFGNDPITDKPWNFAFKADIKPGSDSDRARIDYGVKWRPSIHMPREAARLFFRVTKVEVMRLEDVTEKFAREDGFQIRDGFSALVQFKHFWRQTYGPDARWMWVYWTEPCSKEEATNSD